MSIIGEFESLGECSVNAGTSTFDNTQNFTLADFEQYCAQTDTDSRPSKIVPLAQNNGVESCKNSDLLGAPELSETLERELKLTPTSSWLDSTEHIHNEEFESTLDLSPSIYSRDKRRSAVHMETSRDDKFKETTPWTTDEQEQETKTYPFKVVVDADDDQGLVTSIIESGQQIPSSLMATNDHETITHAFSEVMAIPQIYSNAQPHPFRVELGNDGQQYMIVDSKYLTQNTEDTIPLQVGSNNTYFLAGMPTQHFGEYPVATQCSESQSASTSSSLSSQQEPRAGTPFELFGSGFTDEDMVVDDSMLEEQKRKSLMQMRRREKNKDCSRAFRRKQKEKERTLRHSRSEKQSRGEKLNRENEKLFRMLSKVALQGCEKAKSIAAAGMQTWNKENKIQGVVNHCNM